MLLHRLLIGIITNKIRIRQTGLDTTRSGSATLLNKRDEILSVVIDGLESDPQKVCKNVNLLKEKA